MYKNCHCNYPCDDCPYYGLRPARSEYELDEEDDWDDWGPTWVVPRTA